MKQVTSALLNLAQRLLEHEEGERRDLEGLADGAERAYQKLHQHLVPLLGPEGLNILLARALTLARDSFPILKGVEADKDGRLKGLREAAQGRHLDEATTSFAAVLANFLGLLVTFIGEDFALREVREVWPDVALGGTDLA